MKKIEKPADRALAEAARLSREVVHPPPAVDMSEAGIARRLAEVAEMSRLCLELGELSTSRQREVSASE